VASICFSSIVGRWVDRSQGRLYTLSTTIFVNRFSVILACVLWYFLLENNPSSLDKEWASDFTLRNAMFGVILMLGVFETLSATGNTLSMERDWIVVAASSEGQTYDLTALNAVMRRIDLTCKLISPILISMIISTFGTRTGVLLVAAMSACSVGLEYLCARRVWNSIPRLRSQKPASQRPDEHEDTSSSFLRHLHAFVQDLNQYCSSIVFIPSLALSLLHLSALAYSASLITFLLNVGITLNTITIARAIGSIVEVSSTVVTPIGIQRLSKAKHHGLFYEQVSSADVVEVEASSKGSEVGLFRLGLWGLTWQLINLIPVILSLWSMASGNTNIVTSLTLFFFLSSSRLGLWIYDLTTQQLTQTMTEPSQRSSFAGAENSFVSMFELLQNIAIIVFSRPEQFRWVAGMSFGAVSISTVMYAAWVWRMRGHLVHWDTIIKSCECVKVGFRFGE
jgi:iron-regulated transporter 1